MNIDVESIGLLSLILQDSPKDRQFILCVLARSNSVPTRITFKPNTDYPTFYGYSNSRIPYYLMGKGVLSNVPRKGYTNIKRLIASSHLSYAETAINNAKNWDVHQKLWFIPTFITLDNKTDYKDAELFLVFRDKALDYIKGYVPSHKEALSSHEKYKQLLDEIRSGNKSSHLKERYKKTLSEINSQVSKEEKQEEISKPKLGDSRIEFNPDDGITIYRGAEYIFRGKGKALLTFLSRSKNTSFPIDDIKEKCNPNIINRRSYFKAEKDVRDTVAYIRKNLKVKKGEFFPINKREKNWIWLEK